MSMSTRASFSLLASTLLLLTPAVTFAQTTSSDSGTTVTVSLIARDRSGRAVQDLKPEDLTIIDNGRAAKVLRIESAGRLPVRLGILLTGDQFTFKTQQKAALRLLEGLRPGEDQAFVLTHSLNKRPHRWPSENLAWQSDLKALAKFVEGLQWNEALVSTRGPVMEMLALNPDRAFRRVMLEIRDPGFELSRDFDDYVIARRQTDGKSNSEIAKYQEIAEYQLRNSIVYTSHVYSTMRGSRGWGSGSVQIEELALASGGRLLDWLTIESEMDGIRDDLENEMLVSFETEPGNPQQPHRLEIRTNRKDVRLAYPDHFYPLKPN
jgi:hypothetical protein